MRLAMSLIPGPPSAVFGHPHGDTLNQRKDNAMRLFRRMAALLLSVIMMITYMPAAAFAASEEQDIQVYGKISFEPVKIGTDVELADNDELLWEYLNKELAERTGAAGEAARPMLKSSSRPRGDRLRGTEKLLYDALKSRICALVKPAATSNSTAFRLSFAELLGRDEEYPITDIVDPETHKKIWTHEVPVEDAEQFLDLENYDYAFNMSALINALQADLPYDLYWHDKIKGAYVNLDPVNFYPGSEALYFEVPSSAESEGPGLVFEFNVAEDYQGTDADGNKNALLLDSDKRDRANEAVKKANEIISDPAEGALDTLVKFRDAICGLVDYDDDAAAMPAGVYGDPWQMINVFDDDKNTKTVCEGYAKAFQYLCDNSPLISEAGVDCDSVTGYLSLNGQGSELHMWNILHMPNGSNYIADLTNCDDGSVGYPDKLFLTGCEEGGSVDSGYTYKISGEDNGYIVGYSYDKETRSQYDDDEIAMATVEYHHVHRPVHVEAKAATCVDTGNSEYWHCVGCGAYFGDAGCETEIEEGSWVTPATGEHEWTSAVVEKRATAEETGIVRYTCEVCGDKSKTTEIPKVDPQAEPVNAKAEEGIKAAEAALENGSVEEAEKAAAEAAADAAEAVRQAEEALTAAEESGDEAAVSAAIQDVADASASQAKAQAVAAKISAVEAAKQAADSKSAAAKAAKGTTTAVSRAKTALEDAKAAEKAAAEAYGAAADALDAVRVAGFDEDSDECKAAVKAVQDAEAEKIAAETAASDAAAALTKAQKDYDSAVAAEKKRQGTYNKSIPKVKIKAPSSKKTSVTVKWTKLTAAQIKKSKATRYEIWLCPNTKFAKADTKIKTVLKTKSSVTFTGLKKNKAYYVKVRAIKYVKGVKNVGKWSLRKTINTKRK